MGCGSSAITAPNDIETRAISSLESLPHQPNGESSCRLLDPTTPVSTNESSPDLLSSDGSESFIIPPAGPPMQYCPLPSNCPCAPSRSRGVTKPAGPLGEDCTPNEEKAIPTSVERQRASRSDMSFLPHCQRSSLGDGKCAEPLLDATKDRQAFDHRSA